MERINLIRKVLQELERQEVRYCVLRNYTFLLEKRAVLSASEKSVDMVVSRKDLAAFEKIMNDFSFSKRRPQFSRAHQAYFRIEDLEPISFDVQVGGVHWNDMCYLDEKLIVGNRVKKSFFFVPSDNDTFVMLLVHSILGKRYFKPEYQETVQQLSTTVDFNYVRSLFENTFGPGNAAELISLVKQNKFEEIIARKNRYIAAFLIRKKRMFTFIPLFFRWISWKRLGQPYPLISIIGPDGAGKSTLVSALAEYLATQNRKVKVIYTGRGRGQLLPVAALGRKYKHAEKQRDSHRRPVRWRRKLLYTVSAPVFAADLGLRYLFQILPARRRRKIVITDRYCTDIWLMKHVPLAAKRFLLWFFPQPTLTFYLHNTPEVLHERREEESVEELQRQLGLFSALGERMPLITIKTEDKEQSRKEVLEKIMVFLYRNWY